MALFEKINNSYTGRIVADVQTANKFHSYLKRKKKNHYRVTPEGDIDWEYMKGLLVIWRKTSLTRPVQAGGYRNPSMLLGNEFKNHLDNNFSCIYDTGEARAYL